MKSRALNDSSFLLVFSEEEVIASLTSFLVANDIQSGTVSAVGSVSRGTLAWWDATTRQVFREDFVDQCEVASFSGNVTWSASDTPPPPRVHAHAVLANGPVIRAGHVVSAFAFPEVELVLTTSSARVTRSLDPVSNLWLTNW